MHFAKQWACHPAGGIAVLRALAVTPHAAAAFRVPWCAHG